MKLSKPLNKYFDHTLLKPEAVCEQIDKLCDEAKQYDFYSVCVNTCYVARCADNLRGTDVKVAAVERPARTVPVKSTWYLMWAHLRMAATIM